MATVQDRWYAERDDGAGGKTRVPTEFHGNTGISRWRVHYRTPGGRQRNRSFAKKVLAERFLVGVEASKIDGSFVDPSRGRTTVGEVAERWRASKIGIKASTRARYDSALDTHILPRWETVSLRSVDHDVVQDWVNDLHADGMAGASVRKVVTVFSGVMQAAVRSKRIPANPARELELPAAKSGGKKYLTPAQVEVMAGEAARRAEGQAARTELAVLAQYRLAVFVLAYCGLRWSELAGLRVSAVDVKRRRLRISSAVVEVDGGTELAWGTPKSHEQRTVPIPAFLVAELGEHVKDRAVDDLVFTAPGGGVLRNRNARRGWFNRAAAAAGVSGLTPHELRHTAASLAVSAGANIKALSRMLGHKSAAMTLDVYADLFDDDLEGVAVALDSLRERARVARSLHEAAGEAGEMVAEVAAAP